MTEPLATPALDRWRALGAKIGGPLWRAACWEMSALEAATPDQRNACIARARDIILAAQDRLQRLRAAA